MALSIDFDIDELMRVAKAENWPWHPGWNISPEGNDGSSIQNGGDSGGKLSSGKQLHSRNLP